MLPTWLFLVCLAAFWWGRQPGRLTTVYIASCVFGASAALSVVVLGHAPVTPALFFVPFLMAVAWRHAGIRPWLAGLSLREPGGWLGLYAAWCVFAAVFLPRIFAGELTVYTTSRSEDASMGVQLAMLAPNSTNVTQSAYVVIGLLVVLSLRVLMGQASQHRWLLRGLFVAAGLNAFFALLDGVSAVTRTELGLSIIRNANYAIVAQSVAGLPRLQGAFSEPSSLAAFTTALFACLFALWLKGVERARSGLLAVVSAVVLVLTLSSTAFVAFALVLVLTLALHGWRTVLLARTRRFGWPFGLLLAVIGVGCVLALWMPPWLERFGEIVWVMVVDKHESQSGIERLSWIVACWDNFVDTYGFGVGTGSARGSSWPLVVLGNVGWPGATTMLVALALCLLPSRSQLSSSSQALLFACRMGLLGVLVAASLSGTMIDPGALFYAMAGVIAGLMAPTADRDVAVAAPAPRAPEPAVDWQPTILEPRSF